MNYYVNYGETPFLGWLAIVVLVLCCIALIAALAELDRRRSVDLPPGGRCPSCGLLTAYRDPMLPTYFCHSCFTEHTYRELLAADSRQKGESS